jgi:hypothetical protein
MRHSSILALLAMLSLSPRIQLHADIPPDNSLLTEALKKPKGGMDHVVIDEKASPTDRERRELRDLVNGRTRADTANGRGLIEKMSRWVLYRLTWVERPTDQDADSPHKHASLAQLLDEIYSWNGVFPTLPDPRRENRLVYLKELKAAMLPHLRILLQMRKEVVRVNAARILHRFAQLEGAD